MTQEHADCHRRIQRLLANLKRLEQQRREQFQTIVNYQGELRRLRERIEKVIAWTHDGDWDGVDAGIRPSDVRAALAGEDA